MKYTVVRSFDDGNGCDVLQDLFDNGWEFFRASEYIPPESTPHGTRRHGFIEYILIKNEEDGIKEEETKYDMG